MKYSLSSVLKCPNNGCLNLTVFDSERGTTVNPNDNVNNTSINTEVNEGLLICENCETAYPIVDGIAILLSDSDADAQFQIPFLKSLLVTQKHEAIINNTISRLQESQKTEHGKWNEDEMRYYDKEVSTEELRNSMLSKIKTVPVWRIFVSRERHLINHLKLNKNYKNILEIGSGNSRTVYNIFNPQTYKYNYTGTDISFKRLQVAKKALPDGNFIQCSAMNLPFKNNTFDTVISFGMLHHLPDIKQALDVTSKLLISQGNLLFHEPIIRPTLKFPGVNQFKSAIATYEHSEHDNKINITDTDSYLNKLNFDKISLTLRNSVFRAFTESLYNKITSNKLPSKLAVRSFEIIDLFFLYTICKIFKSLGAGSVYGIYRKIN